MDEKKPYDFIILSTAKFLFGIGWRQIAKVTKTNIKTYTSNVYRETVYFDDQQIKALNMLLGFDLRDPDDCKKVMDISSYVENITNQEIVNILNHDEISNSELATMLEIALSTVISKRNRGGSFKMHEKFTILTILRPNRLARFYGDDKPIEEPKPKENLFALKTVGGKYHLIDNNGLVFKFASNY